MARDALVFEGRRFRAARVTGRRSWHFEGSAADAFGVSTPIFVIEAKSGGQLWKTTRPTAAWRDFADVDPSDEAAVLRFVGKHGDPFNKLGPKTWVDTSGWPTLRNKLTRVAAVWAPTDTHGVSRYHAGLATVVF